MADYKETTVSGTKWTRAVKVIVENPLGQLPTIQIVEEDVINASGAQIKQTVDVLNCAFDQNNTTHVAVYTALNNLYIALREARDTELARIAAL